jgi:hypothetical protein
VIIRFPANRHWGANKIAAARKEDVGQDSDVLRTAQGWLVEIQRGRQELHDLHRSGRPLLDHIDAQILVGLQKWPFESCRSLALRLGCDPKMVDNHLVDSIWFGSFPFALGAHARTIDFARRRIEGPRAMLSVSEAAAENERRCFATGDES